MTYAELGQRLAALGCPGVSDLTSDVEGRLTENGADRNKILKWILDIITEKLEEKVLAKGHNQDEEETTPKPLQLDNFGEKVLWTIKFYFAFD